MMGTYFSRRLPSLCCAAVYWGIGLTAAIALGAEIEIGQIVTVESDDAEFITSTRELRGRLKKGDQVEVARVTPHAVGGYAVIDGKRVPGWIRKADLARSSTDAAVAEAKPRLPTIPPKKLVPIELEVSQFTMKELGEESPHPGDTFSDAAVTDDGAVWFATSRGLFRMFEGMAVKHAPFEAKEDPEAIRTLRAADDSLWVVFPKHGLAKYLNGEWTTYPRPERELPPNRPWGSAAAVAPDGAFWCIGNNCLLRFDGERWEPHLEKEIGKNFFAPIHFAFDSGGRLWGGATNVDLLRYQNGKHELPRGWPSFSWGAISISPDDTVYIGFDNPVEKEGGLLVARGDRWNLLTTENSRLPTNRVTALHHAPDGTLWMGFDGHGVARKAGDDWQFFPEEFRLQGWNLIRRIVVDKDGTAWVWGRRFFRAVPQASTTPSNE